MSYCIRLCVCTHTHTHTRTHARTHAHTDTDTHARNLCMPRIPATVCRIVMEFLYCIPTSGLNLK